MENQKNYYECPLCKLRVYHGINCNYSTCLCRNCTSDFLEKNRTLILEDYNLKQKAGKISKKYNLNHKTVVNFFRNENLDLNRGPKIDYTNYKFHSWTIIKFAYKKFGRNYWYCRCDCGYEKVMDISEIKRKDRKVIRHCIKCRELHKQTKDYPNYTGCGDITGSHWSTICNNAKSRGLIFSISIEDAWNLFVNQEKKCALTGRNLILRPLNQKTASLDRINSDKGYTLDNIQWIHKDINFMKQDYDQTYFIQICQEITKHQNANFALQTISK